MQLRRAARDGIVVVHDGDGVADACEMRGHFESGASCADDEDFHDRLSSLVVGDRVLFHRGDSEDFFVEPVDVTAAVSRADEAATCRVENGRLLRREHRGHGDVHVRVMSESTKLVLGLDDVPLKGGPAFGVLVSRNEAGAEQRIELGLRAARADEHRPELVGLLVLVGGRRHRATSGSVETAGPA